MKPKQTLGSLPALVVAVLLAFLLAACGDNTPTNAPVTTTAVTTASTTAPATTAVATTPATTASSTTALATASATTPAAAATSYPLTLTDDSKRTVKIEKAPQKIISLAPSNTELLYALGLGERVVGVDDLSDYPEEAKKKEKIGGFSKTNLEKIVSLSPDLVLAAGITSKELLTTLEQRNLTVVVFNPSNVAGIADNLKLLGQITNVPDKAEAAITEFKKKIDEVTAKVKNAKAKPRVFYELDSSGFTVGNGSFINDILNLVGAQNIAAEGTNPYPQLSQEVVISKDPQVILVGDDSGGETTPEKIMARPGWSNISAVKEKRVFALTANWVNRPGPRTALGVEQVAKALYPDLFK